MTKLTKTAAEQLYQMKAFIFSTNGCLVDDNDVTYIYCIKNLWSNATGIYMVGNSGSGEIIKDRINFSQVNVLYRAMLRGDEDFQLFVK